VLKAGINQLRVTLWFFYGTMAKGRDNNQQVTATAKARIQTSKTDQRSGAARDEMSQKTW
jgi:hypothetical protein